MTDRSQQETETSNFFLLFFKKEKEEDTIPHMTCMQHNLTSNVQIDLCLKKQKKKGNETKQGLRLINNNLQEKYMYTRGVHGQ